MINASTLSLVLLLVATGAVRYVSGRPFVAKYISRTFWGCVLVIFAIQDYWAYAQFRLWESSEPSKYLIPPYNGWSYFIQYVGWHLYAPYIISLIIALIFFYLARWYNSRHDFSFFHNEEYYFIALSIFLSGHPGWIIYGALLMVVSMAVIAFRNLVLRKPEKFSLYYFWFPISAIAILIMWALYGVVFISKLGV